MKSINLIVLFLLTYSVIVAQNLAPGPLTTFNSADNIAIKKAVSMQSNSKSLNSRWYDYASSIDTLNSNLGVYNKSYVFPDTNIYAIFGSSVSRPWVHSIVTIVDPTSSVYNQAGQQNITNQVPYMLDSARIITKYTRNTNANIVDTLVFQFFTSNVPGDINEYYFTGMSMSYGVDTVKFKSVPRNGISVDILSKVTYKLPLNVADTVSTNGLNFFSVAVPSALSVNAGELVGVSVTFRPGFSYSATDTLNNLNYIEIISMEEKGSSTFPTYNPGDFSSSQIISTEALNSGSSWYNMFIPTIAYSAPFGLEHHMIQMHLTTSAISNIITTSSIPTTGGTVLGSGLYNDNQNCDLIAVPSPNYVFSNWTENGAIVSTDSIYNFVVNTDRDIVANFNFVAPLDLIISEHLVGTSNNKAIELYNPTGNDVNLLDYSLVRYSNGGTTPYSVGLSGVIKADSTYVIVLDKRDPNATGMDTMVDPALQLLADTFVCPVYSINKMMYFNGNDAVVLQKNNNVYVDIIGKIGEDPGIGWTTDSVYGYTSNGGAIPWTKFHSLVRKNTINVGITVNPQYFNPSVEWDTIGIDDFSNIGHFNYMLPVSYNITTSSLPTNGGNIIGDGSYNDNQNCDLIAVPSPNYVFSNWTENGAIVSTNTIYSFVVNSDRSIVANFNFVAQLDLIISEYVEGSYNNKAIELYNPAANSINLQDYSLYKFTNGSISPSIVDLRGIIAPNSTYVIVLDKRDPNANGIDTMVDLALQLLADTFVCPIYSQNNLMYFNGNDAVALTKNNGVLVDVFGKIGENPGTGWTIDSASAFTSAGGADPWTRNHTMVRKPFINIGITNNPSYFNPSVEWMLLPMDDFSGIGSHVYVAPTYYNVTTSSIPSTGGIVNGAGTFIGSQNCVLEAVASANYEFINWTENGAIVSVNSIYSFVVNSDRSIVANFDFVDGINNVNINNDIYIFPNPSTGLFTINLNDNELNRVEVFNSIGQLILFKQYNNSPNRISVDLKDYNSGIYIVNITDNNGRLISKKIIKK